MSYRWCYFIFWRVELNNRKLVVALHPSFFLLEKIWRNLGRCQNFWKTWNNSSEAGRCILNNQSIGLFSAADFYLSVEFHLHDCIILISCPLFAAYISGWWMKYSTGAAAEMEVSIIWKYANIHLYSISLLSHSNIFLQL